MDHVKAFKCFSHPLTNISYPFNDLSKPFKRLLHPFTEYQNPFNVIDKPFPRFSQPFTKIQCPLNGLNKAFKRLPCPFNLGESRNQPRDIKLDRRLVIKNKHTHTDSKRFSVSVKIPKRAMYLDNMAF